MGELRRAALGTKKDQNNKSETMKKSDSVVNLTKPSLYGIYDTSHMLDGVDTEEVVSRPTTTHKKVAKTKSFSIPLAFKLIILAGAAYLFNEVTRNCNSNLVALNLGQRLGSRLPLSVANLFIFSLYDKLRPGHYISVTSDMGIACDSFAALAFQGLLMALIMPLFDRIVPSLMRKRLLLSDPLRQKHRGYANVAQDTVRAVITFMGISYAIRKIEWSSFLQVAIVWSLINPGLWLLLDGTLAGLIASSAVAAALCAVVYFEHTALINAIGLSTEDSIAFSLWIGSFFFSGAIVFGMMGRHLL